MMLISEVLCTVVLKIRIIACTDLDYVFLWFDNFELCSQFECLLGVDVVCFHRSFLSTASTTCAVRSCCSATTHLTRMSCGLLHPLKTSSTALLLRLFCQVRSLLWTVCWWYFECYSVELSVVFLFFLKLSCTCINTPLDVSVLARVFWCHWFRMSVQVYARSHLVFEVFRFVILTLSNMYVN